MNKDMILVLDYAAENALEIARRLRGEQIYAKVVSCETTAAQVKEMAPRGVILSGEAMGKACEMDGALLELGIPVLAIGHTAHMLLSAMGGASADDAIVEKKALVQYGRSALFAGLSEGERYIRRAATLMLPTGVEEIASAGGCAMAFEDPQRRHYGVQFELERNDPDSSNMLMNYAQDVCGCTGWWTLDAAMEKAEAILAEAASRGGQALCAVSGGVDSTLAALLTHRAFGDRMTAVFMDNGLMRAGEAEAVSAAYAALGVPLTVVDRSGEVLEALAGKCGDDEKRAVVMQRLYREIIERSEVIQGEKLLVLCTNYSDFLHGGSGASEWTNCGMTIIEPLLELFKDEVRAMARRLGMSEALVDRKPFPALGLGARIVGEVTAQRLHALRTAEAIFREEIERGSLERKLYKYFPVLFGGDTPGGELLVLRAVTLSGGMLVPARLPYDLTERTVSRILAACPTLARVFYDQTPTPLGRETYA